MPITPKIGPLPHMQAEWLPLHTGCSQLSAAHQGESRGSVEMPSQPPTQHTILLFPAVCHTATTKWSGLTLLDASEKMFHTCSRTESLCTFRLFLIQFCRHKEKATVPSDRSLMGRTPVWEHRLNPYLKLCLFSGNIVKSTDLLQKFSNLRADIGFLY